MKTVRGLLLGGILFAGACGGGGSSGGGGSTPPPPGTPPAVAITGPGPVLSAATLGVPISPITFTATGTAPFVWTLTGGNLTAGLTLSNGGVLSGTPTAAGNYFFTVTVTDANGSDSGDFTQNVGTTTTESEPNDDFVTASSLALGSHATGVITADDVDFWSFPATAGQVIRVELFGVRSEFSSWNTNANLPRLALIAPSGIDFLVGHDRDNAGAAGWPWGDHDLDIPMFFVPADGIYFVRIDSYLAATHGGLYALLITDVTPPSLQTESEPNDDTATATAITPGMVRGVKVDDEDDVYSFDIVDPTLVYFEVTAYRNGVFGNGGAPDDDYIDTSIELIDTDGSTVIAANYQVFFSDPAINYHISTPGTYYLRVTESVSGTDGDGDYFLTFTATPVGSITEAEPNEDTTEATPIVYGDVVSGDVNGGETDWFSFSGSAGDIVRLFWFEPGASQVASDTVSINYMIDDSTFMQRAVSTTGVNQLACIRAILPSTGTFYIRIQPDGGFTPYTFQLTLFKDATFETEANDSNGTANAIPGSGRVAGAINTSSDVDVFSFSAQTGDVFTFSIHAGDGSSSNGFPNHTRYTSAFAELLPDLEVVDSLGATLGATPYGGSPFSGESVTNGVATSELTFVAPSAGTFYIRVTASDGAGSDDHRYLLERR